MRAFLSSLLLLSLLVLAVPAAGQPTPDPLDPGFHASIDDAVVHGTVTPPGAEITEKEAELRAYDDLVYDYPDLTDETLTARYFKDGRFGPVADVAREYHPRADVRVVRDAEWGVPHIYGETDEAMAFGAGYASAEDRLPIMELLRALGRAEAFELLGTAPAWLADAELIRLYGYTEEEFQAQLDRLPEVYGDDGADAKALVEAHTAGINHFITQMQQGQVPQPAGLADLLPPNEVAPWRPTDVVAVVSIVRALFGAGGGGELGNAARLAALVDAYGDEQAIAVYEDFRNRFNLDGPMHTPDPRFTTMVPPMPLPGSEGNVGPVSPGAPGPQGMLEELASLFPGGAAQAAADLGALAEASEIRWDRLRVESPAAVVDLSRAPESSMSNWLAIGADRSATGHPILLGGPQAGYWDPQILVESELHSPTIHARGAGFPGLSTLVVIGRSHQAAWTATAGGSDMIDTYIEVLCDPDGAEPTEQEVHYLHDADGHGDHECVPMDRRLHRESASLPGGELLPAIYAERTVHGPVVARGRLGDVPVAVSSKRSTYMAEIDPAISILRMNRGEAETGEDFVDIFGEGHTLSTSWAYVNDREIAWFHGGLYPRRPDTIHPDLPVWGTGEWEWERGPDGEDLFYGTREHPHEVAPDRGYAVSWNNRIAPNWGANDSNWGFSARYRGDLLEDEVLAAEERGELIDPVSLTQMMIRAGLADLRATRVLPQLLRVLEATPAPSEREARMADLLRSWIDPADNPDGIGLRRDGDRDGSYDQGAAIAIMDAWWTPLIHAMYDPALGRSVASVSRQGFHNAPGSAGSAFQGGFYGQVWTDLSMALGDEVLSPTSQVYCGSDALGVDGDLETCSARLWAALAAAGDALVDDQGDDPSAWDADAQGERILFLPNPLLSMHWVNRPTTQVLAMFGARAADGGPPARGRPEGAGPPDGRGPGLRGAGDGPLPVTGGSLALAGMLVLALGGGLARRRGRS